MPGVRGPIGHPIGAWLSHSFPTMSEMSRKSRPPPARQRLSTLLVRTKKTRISVSFCQLYLYCTLIYHDMTTVWNREDPKSVGSSKICMGLCIGSSKGPLKYRPMIMGGRGVCVDHLGIFEDRVVQIPGGRSERGYPQVGSRRLYGCRQLACVRGYKAQKSAHRSGPLNTWSS